MLNLKKKLQVLCHRNVLHACMRLTFDRATCAMPCLLKPSLCTCIFVFIFVFLYCPALLAWPLWSNLPSHCLAIDWLCTATLQSRHKSATQLTPASPYLLRWYSGKSAKNQEHMSSFRIVFDTNCWSQFVSLSQTPIAKSLISAWWCILLIL